MKEQKAKKVASKLLEALESKNLDSIGDIFEYLEEKDDLSFFLTKSILKERFINLIVLEYRDIFKRFLVERIENGVLDPSILLFSDDQGNSLVMRILQGSIDKGVFEYLDILLSLNPLLLKMVNDDGMVPLLEAIVKNNLNLIRLFLYYNAPIENVYNGRSVLEFAIERKASKDIQNKLEQELVRRRSHISTNNLKDSDDDDLLTLSDILYLKKLNKRIRNLRVTSYERLGMLKRKRNLYYSLCKDDTIVSREDLYKMARFFGIKNYLNQSKKQICKKMSDVINKRALE